MFSRLFTLLIMASAFAVANADLPFRLHRFDQFKALPQSENAIVFFGNSITNMHEWWEAFGSQQNILNRGNSGATTPELLDNVATVIALKPSKLFIEIGTNDLGNKNLADPDSVAGRIAAIVERVRMDSPDTKIFVQSILPSEVGIRSKEVITQTNTRIKNLVEPLGATYIDLFDLMGGIPTKEISYDGLHLTSKGYAKWLDRIAPLVGYESIYTPEMTENNGGIPGNSFGMRNTYFSAFPVKSTDILMIGDEMIHGGEWHELLSNPSVKNRGTGWGYGGLPIKSLINAIEPILAANGNKETPSRIILYAGTQDLYAKGADLDSVAAGYGELIKKIREYAPASKTRIDILSLIPRNNVSDNESLTIPFNRMIQSLASENDNIGFIDIYTVLSNPDNTADSNYVDDHNYLTGKGYKEVARVLASFIPSSCAQ